MIKIAEYIYACASFGVSIKPGAETYAPNELKRLIVEALTISDDNDLMEARQTGGFLIGKESRTVTTLAEFYKWKIDKIQYEKQQTVKKAIKQYRRNQYNSNSVALGQKLIANGVALVCVQCGRIDDLTIDHIIPLSKGGTDDLYNLQFLCRKHNGAKGATL